MDSEPLPDHYKALGVDRNADTAAIKAAHRKLVLGCHPDKVKVTDPVLRQEKQEEFHRIQKAYEVLTDEKERATYEANLTLEALRKEKLARGGASSSREKSTRFDPRATAGTSTRYTTEERRPSAVYDDDRYYDDRDRDRDRRGSTRGGGKYETYDAYPKSGSSPRTERESSRSAKASAERARSERNKARDKEERRQHKFVSVESESSADEKARYEASYKRRSQEDEAQRLAADARRKADERRSYEDSRYSSGTHSKMSTLEEEAKRYQHKSRAQVEAEIRPSPGRTSSRDHYGESGRSSRKESRPENPRRSSARPKERATSSSTRERDPGFIVDWAKEDSSSRRPPPLKAYNSSPASIEVPRTMPQRAYTELPRDHRSSTSPPPAFHRSQTMPSVPHSSSRSKPAGSRPSTLRDSMTPEHPSEFPSIPQAQPSNSKTKYYRYPDPVGGAPLRPDDIMAGGHRTVLREPERQRHRSPSPLTRPPMGANRPSDINTPKSTTIPPPPMGRSSRNVSPVREERGRSSRPLYGEIPSNHGRPRVQRQASYSPNEVHYAPKYGPEDVRWAPRGREHEREYGPSKPILGRTATYAY